MNHYTDVNPIIVCGTGRSGTRQFADILSLHGKVSLIGEIQRAFQRDILSMAQRKEIAAKNKPRELSKWRSDKLAFLYHSWRIFAKSSIDLPADTQFIGHKTPGSELLFEQYEDFFRTEEKKPTYFYCGRNFESTWKSFKAMQWNPHRNVSDFSSVYLTSWGAFEKMKEAIPDRTILLNLDDYVAASEKEVFCKENIFSPLGLQIDERLSNALSAVQNRNSSLNTVGSAPKDLTADELEYIESNSELKSLGSKYFQ